MTEKLLSEKLIEENKQLKDRLSLMEKQLSTISEEIKTFPQQPATPAAPKEEKRGHATVEEIDNCPECHRNFHVDEYKAKLLANAKPQIIKEHNAKHLTLKHPVICEGCGEITEKEDSKCPTCGGTKARRI